MTTTSVRTGDIVLYRTPAARVDEATLIAAIVLLTHDDWAEGQHSADGTWFPQTAVPQPKPGCVVLQTFGLIPAPSKPGMFIPDQQIYMNVAEGAAVGQFVRRT